MNSIQQKLEETYSSDDSSEYEFWKDNKLELDGALIDNKKTNILYYINDENKSKTLTMVFPKKSIEFEIGNNFILHKHMKKIFDECDKMWLDLQEKISQISVEKYKITLKDKILSSKDRHVEPEDRNISMAFQDNSLFPHYNILENIKSKEAILVDARSNGRFCGLIPETRKNLKSGHIPNAINLPFLEVLKDGEFLSINEISAIFKKLKIDKRPKIFTCGSGLTACILILASTLISEDNHFLYDGSWSEWGQLEGVPIF